MNKQIKKQNWQEGTDDLENLVAWDYKVVPFSDIHFRINDRLDVWPSTRKWYDMKTKRTGQYQKLESFVKDFLPT